jgi:hypothetical protein
LIAFSFSRAEQRDLTEKSSIEQSMGMPLNKMSMTEAVKNGVVGLKMEVKAFIAVPSKGLLSRCTAINPPYMYRRNKVKASFWHNLLCMNGVSLAKLFLYIILPSFSSVQLTFNINVKSSF